MPITALYASLLAGLFVLLSARVIHARRAARVPVGDGGDEVLLRRMRVHANFAEYVPLALVLMALAESLNAYPILLHALGMALLVGRTVHAYGVSQMREVYKLRVFGMAATLIALAAAAAACLVGGLMRLM